MSKYHVSGTVEGKMVDTVVEAGTGADAYKSVLEGRWPCFGKAWKAERALWVIRHVRLNVKQLV